MMQDWVRQRPGMYVGDTSDGTGLVFLVLEVVSNSLDAWMAGRCTRVSVAIDADGTVVVEDDGPGIPSSGAEQMPSLAELLDTISIRPTVDGHRPHAHLGMGVGLAVVQRVCDRFELVSVRGGVRARALYSRGVAVEPIVVEATTLPSGTRVSFHPDPEIFGPARVRVADVARHLDDLAFLAPGLSVSWSSVGDAAADRGMAGRVARLVGEPLGGVAQHLGRFSTKVGPVDVDVAIAWHRSGAGARTIESFVNLGRTRGDGTHVEGLLDGVRRFAPRRGRDSGMVAAVSVVLSDVLFGNPTRDRLDSPHARPAVAAATERALVAWASAHPDAAAQLRGRDVGR